MSYRQRCAANMCNPAPSHGAEKNLQHHGDDGKDQPPQRGQINPRGDI
ncbi:hypothetical protein J2S34_003489 [Nitrobacter winogradskyi]|uniref:Uncharacterized protein n=1 Tax=Nitrobacter winogradskyi TaxID=913 RepID=A0ACC6AN22_NITWI|nr:hypothetical protein [Nitrobacter winogradskyi]